MINATLCDIDYTSHNEVKRLNLWLFQSWLHTRNYQQYPGNGLNDRSYVQDGLFLYTNTTTKSNAVEFISKVSVRHVIKWVRNGEWNRESSKLLDKAKDIIEQWNKK